MCSSHQAFSVSQCGGGGGNSTLGGPCGRTPVFGTGDFSNSSTPPCSNLERRRGFEPRSPSLQPGRSPLAVAAQWHPRGDSNTQSRVWNPLASPSATGAYGAPGRVRTGTVRLLRPLSLSVGLKARISRLGRIRTDTGHVLSVLPLPSWATSL
jgi:hypothetical protein